MTLGEQELCGLRFVLYLSVTDFKARILPNGKLNVHEPVHSQDERPLWIVLMPMQPSDEALLFINGMHETKRKK